MSEEEKEAIERAKFLASIPTYLEKEMCKNLLNYIDKLQKENQKLKESIEKLSLEIEELVESNDELNEELLNLMEE